MCADPMMLGAICVAGNKLGTKLNAAMAKCSGDEEMAKGRERRPIKGIYIQAKIKISHIYQLNFHETHRPVMG